ncbi:ABC transporter substrate-binding protein [Streptosporangium sp. NPDC020072]|uniref:ABC transporter substrate-binding protein n=1 Tax=Streptosporangium sp. NPDC020072 TaxID=3154788 RepID=UPI00342B734C
MRLKRLLAVIIALPFGTLVACSTSVPRTNAPVASLPEKTTLTIGTMPIPDTAGLQLAIKRRLFEQAGLTVKTETIQGAGPAIPNLVSGHLDVCLLNYVTAFIAQSEQVADLGFIADAYQGGPGTFLLMTKPDSGIKTPADLKGKKIAVATLRSIATLTTTVTLKVHGLTADDVTFVEIPLPNMPAALRAGSIDAAWMVEPFITAARTRDGALTLADTAIGPTADFPIAGWGVTKKFARENPKTVAIVRRVLEEGQRMAAADRKAVTDIIPGYTQISPSDARIITLGVYPQTLNGSRLDRVSAYMVEQSYLKKPLDVTSMLLPGPTPSSWNGAS